MYEVLDLCMNKCLILLQQRLCYTDVPVYIRRLTANDKNFPGSDPSDPDFAAATGSPGLDDTNMSNGEGCTKRLKLENGQHHHNGAHLPLFGENRRRSNRRQKVRGEKSIIVSSNMKLRDFKVKASGASPNYYSCSFSS